MGKQCKKLHTRQDDPIGIEYVDPATLKAADYNPRTISNEGLGRLARLLDTHGFVAPVIVRKEDNLIIGGHQRIKANSIRTNPDTLIPVVFLSGISDDRAKALNISLNNDMAQGGFDNDKLSQLLTDIDNKGFNTADSTGFSLGEISGIKKNTEQDIADIEIVDIPSAKKQVIWIFMGVPLDSYGEVSSHLAAIENVSSISLQVARQDDKE